jgi:hypothetical protein
MTIHGNLRLCGALAALLLSSSPARADVIAEWNAIALDLVSSSERSEARAVRTMATVHVAMFEVINFIEGGYVPRFLVRPPAPLGGSGEAAAAAAAYHVLVESHPAAKAALDAALERSLAALPDEHDRTSARVWGRHLGANIQAALASAGSEASDGPPTAHVSRARASGAGSTASLASLNAMVTRLIDARRMKAIDAARIHALAWMAVGDAYAASRDSKFNAIGAATLAVLASEFGSAGVPIKADIEIGTKAGMQALMSYRPAH